MSTTQAQVRLAALPPDIPAASAAREAAPTGAPIGWADFCRKNPGDCAVADEPPATVQLTPRTWRAIVGINAKVNREITPISDMDHWGVLESWDYPTDGKGDCEDYALLKRKLLMQAGLPRQSLLITVVRDLDGEGHAVLTVKTDHGDYVLDNKRRRVLPWTETGYRFLKRQSAANPNRWVSLGGPDPSFATAAQ